MRASRGLGKFGFTLALLGLMTGCAAGIEQKVNYGLNHYHMGLYGQAIPALVSAADSLDRPGPVDQVQNYYDGMGFGDGAVDWRLFLYGPEPNYEFMKNATNSKTVRFYWAGEIE